MTIKVEHVFCWHSSANCAQVFPYLSYVLYICLIFLFGEETNLKNTQRTLGNNSSALVVFLSQYLCQVKVPKNQPSKARSQPLCISNDRTFDQPLHDQVCEIKISLVGVDDGSTNIQKQHINGNWLRFRALRFFCQRFWWSVYSLYMHIF